jgi:TPP-dependent pyruvate/acetoin dehydrogenase alpha subunit
VALAICGDGSTSNGRWHESLNVSAIHKLPVIWVVNNNQYAYSTPNPLEFAVPTIAERAAAYGIPGVRVAGANVLEVYEAVRDAIARARAGDGPSLVESVSLRWRGHAGHDAATYVPKELLETTMSDEDPVARFEELLLADGVVDAARVKEVEDRIEQEFAAGYEFAQASPFPVGDDVTKGLYTDDGYWLSEPSREGGTGS